MSATLSQMVLSNVHESLNLSDHTVMLKIPTKGPNIILPCDLIQGTAHERSHLNIFISEAAASPDFDPRTLKKTMIFINDLAGIRNVVHQLQA